MECESCELKKAPRRTTRSKSVKPDETVALVEEWAVPVEFTWRPQPRQATFLQACGLLPFLTDGSAPVQPTARLIGYGGAAGGGKTDANLGLALTAAYAFPSCRVGFFRRTFPELEGAEGAIQRSMELFTPIAGAKYNDGKHKWTFPSGSTLHFCSCQHEKDRFGYQSTQFDVLIIDEATHFTWRIVDYLITRNRATVKGSWPFMALTTNPGNVGHMWYKQLFIEPGEVEQTHDAVTPNGKIERTHFIPAYLEDNPILRERDPDYERKLDNRDEVTQRALRHGDWGISSGLFFPGFLLKAPEGMHPHVIPATQIPQSWLLLGSVDYGHNPGFPEEKPFIYELFAMAHDGHCYLIDMLAAAYWDVARQTEEVRRLEERYSPMRVIYRVGCKSMFTEWKKGAPTVAEDYAAAGVPVVEPNSDRVNGWARCREWLKLDAKGVPWFQVFDRCRHFTKLVQGAVIDEAHPEDISPECEEHALEAWRHFVMSRPVVPWTQEGEVPMFSAAWLAKQRLSSIE